MNEKLTRTEIAELHNAIKSLNKTLKSLESRKEDLRDGSKSSKVLIAMKAVYAAIESEDCDE